MKKKKEEVQIPTTMFNSQKIWITHSELSTAGDAIQGLGKLINSDYLGGYFHETPDQDIIHIHLGLAVEALGDHVKSLQATLQRNTADFIGGSIH